MPLAESVLTSLASAATTTTASKSIENAGGLGPALSQHSMILIGSGVALGATGLLAKGKKMPLVDLPKNWGLIGGALLIGAGLYGKFAAQPPMPPEV